MKFIDEAIVDVKAGHGGKGCVSFRREKFVPRGGPDGGNGGDGGSVIFFATNRMSTLMDFYYKKKIQAKDGVKGMGARKDGKSAPDEIIPVPIGTVVIDLQTKTILADFTKEGQQEVIVKGGRGGKGNAFFVNSVRQAPQFAQDGEEGEHKTIKLELKLIADVALIGLPNAGKSTLISTISNAHPKIADYPFTTLSPVLGVVAYKDFDPFVVADLPGLIEGAHDGKGLGHKFLKHSERTRIFIHLVSVSPDEMVSPLDRYHLIQNELISYDKKFKKKKHLVLLSKSELVSLAEQKEIINSFREQGIDPLPFSSVTGMNKDRFLNQVIKMLQNT